ncbi:MAP kinase kinase MKK1/SSP32 [Spathaspora sp. JA1]|nr:MAP kinase kinase MKK1/SSP32 [Spathaspora sp. JA1]
MSGIPLFNIPNTKRPANSKLLPNLTIPLEDPTPPNVNQFNAHHIHQSVHSQQQPQPQQPQQQSYQYQSPQLHLQPIPSYYSSSSPSLSSNTPTNSQSSVTSLRRKPPPPIDTNGSNSNYTTSPIDGVGDKDDVNMMIDQEQNDMGEEDTLLQKHHLEQLTPYDWHLFANANQLIEIDKLGEGNGGSVTKCRINQIPNQIFALKLIITDPNPDIQKQIYRELEIARKCQHPNIVTYYGTFILEKQSMIGITMEYMDGQSLDSIYKEVLKRDCTNRINEKVLRKIANGVLSGLDYLHSKSIIHRDIKPSNILLDTQGNVKLCDFGVSGIAVNSLASTFVGTQYYMAPERITGASYSITSDIWSLGMSLLEVANGKFPIDLVLYGPIEVVDMISKSELELYDSPSENIYWTQEFKQFIAKCLIKDPSKRPIPRQLLRDDEWCLAQQKEIVKMAKFVKVVWQLNH